MDVINKVDKAERWRSNHQDSKIIAGLRILLGLTLVFLGVYFAQNTHELQSAMSYSRFGFGSMAWVHYIVMAHVAGGLMIASGFLTRVAILFQLPILIGAIIVNTQRGVFTAYSETVLAVIVFFMVLFFLFFDSGIFSLDNFLKRKIFYQ